MSVIARRKVVIIGDGATGKTCVLSVFKEGKYPIEYIPTVFDNFVATVQLDSNYVELALYDTAGQEDYDRIRPLSYPDTHVILICFAVDMPDSLENVMTKWYPEASHFCPDASIFLVACKVDLRNDQHVNYRLSKSGHHPISTFEGQQMASMIGATEYVECSAMINYNVGRVFELATRAALKIKTRRDRKRDKCKVL